MIHGHLRHRCGARKASPVYGAPVERQESAIEMTASMCSSVFTPEPDVADNTIDGPRQSGLSWSFRSERPVWCSTDSMDAARAIQAGRPSRSGG